MKRIWRIGITLALGLAAGTALGQTSPNQTFSLLEGPGYEGGWRFPGGYGMGYGGSAGTYEGSVLSGLGSYARGVGEYNYYSALAWREAEEARAHSIKNHKLAVENWIALRKAHQERRKAQWEKEKLTPEQVARIVESNRPDRLSASYYEPATGTLHWPVVLQDEMFAAEREALGAAFAKRTATDVGADSLFYDQVRQLTARMAAKLSDRSKELPPLQVISARKFLVGLKHESLLPMEVKALALGE